MSRGWLRNTLAVWVKDWRRYRRALDSAGAGYLALCNRYERLECAPDGIGYRCDWRWTSELHAPHYLPSLGRRLLARALADYPVGNRPQDRDRGEPEICFLIGHRGMERRPLLLATLRSIEAQVGARIECIVVEQDATPRLAGSLPEWVRHVHTPPTDPALPYSRSWAFNAGARHARAPVLVLHDNDMLVPRDYATQALKRVREGWEVLNLKRFVFYLSQRHTQAVLSQQASLTASAPESIVQNLEGGGSMVITREAFDAIGGFDEGFVGWGGEDVEFWERAQTRRVWPYAHLPIVHLWHAAQPGKHAADNAALARYRERALIPVQERITGLRAARP
jgi:hypothetical protein